MSEELAWDFGFVLYNFGLPLSDDPMEPGTWPHGINLGTDSLVVVSGDDVRVETLSSEHPALKTILSAFRDYSGRMYSPAVLLRSRKAPSSATKELDSIVNFRNAIALSFVLPSRARTATGNRTDVPVWSDYFDFHPIQLSKAGSPVLDSVAVLNLLMGDRAMHFSPSPYVGVFSSRLLIADQYLYRVLGNEWKIRHCAPAVDEPFGRTLFRSLEVAYQACSVGAKNQGSLHDYGVQVALWVSAIEILAWPTKNYANAQYVVDFLNDATLPPALKTQRFTATVGKRTVTNLNVYQYAYSELNNSRDDFLHGNPVSINNLIATSGTFRIRLPVVASLVYRAVLETFLRANYPRDPDSWEDDLLLIEERISDWLYDTAWRELFSKSDKADE